MDDNTVSVEDNSVNDSSADDSSVNDSLADDSSEDDNSLDDTASRAPRSLTSQDAAEVREYPTPPLVASIRAEYERARALAEGALAQVADAELCAPGAGGCNSIATICRHVAGNLRSRFTDFLTTDGEKPWRRRDEEFQARTLTRAELLDDWQTGWHALWTALAALSEADLARTVTIRAQPLAVHAALHRSLAHTSYHVGQIVAAARALRGSAWTTLSVAPGASEAYNARPTHETAEAHTAALRARLGPRDPGP